MLIDPFTIVAQVVNFAVLVVVLKIVLYDRIIGAMDTREAAIAQRLDEAEERERQADDALRHHRQQIDEIDRRRVELLDDARTAADDRRRELLESARRDIDEQRRRWQSALRRDQRNLARDVGARTANSALAVCRRILRDVADADLAHRAVEVALEHLVAAGDLDGLVESGGGSTITARTAFDSDSTRELIRSRLGEFGLADHLTFETDPTLLIGIELVSPTESIQWNADDYLEQLGGVVAELLDEMPSGTTAQDGSDGPGDDGAERPEAEGQIHVDTG